MSLRRIAFSGMIVVMTVGLLLTYVFLRDERQPRTIAPARPAAPVRPWKTSPKAESEANENFEVESHSTANAPSRGTSLGPNWPQFNGPNRDNRSAETGLMQSWPTEGPPLLWVSRGLGDGYSSVAVVNGVIYTMGNKGAIEAIMAFDAGTGEKLWSTPIAEASRQNAGNGPRSTPAVSDGAVYGIGADGELACLDADSGAVRWQKNILREFSGTNPYWRISESVLIDGDQLICTPGGEQATLVALNKETGDVIWQASVLGGDRASYASANLADVGGVRQYVQFTTNGTVGVRADNGDFLWRDNSAANGTANCSSPLVVGDRVFTASAYGIGGSLVRLAATDSQITASLVYHTSDMKSYHGDMVIVDGLLYGSSDPGILTCIDLESGKVKWQDRSVGQGAVTYADGRVYLRGEQGPVALVEATGEGYHECGRFDQPQRSSQQAWAHPVVVAGKLFLRDQGVLLCYDLKSSEEPSKAP